MTTKKQVVAGKTMIEDVDHGFDALLKRVLDAEAVLTVGVHEAEGAAEHDGGVTLAEIASFHEYGLGVPRRSFIADWEDENRDRHKAQLRAMAKAVIDGKLPSVENALERLGLLYVGEIQRRIAQGIAPELAESTVKKKGSSVPLIDTGQLRSAILSKVTKR